MKKNKKINVLIIGYGKIGKIREKILRKNRYINKIYIYDKVNARKKNIIESLSKKNLKNIDAAFVATPNYLNHKYTAFLLKENIHTFCEKPPANNLKNLLIVEKILKKRKKIKLMYGFNHRHHESIISALKFIKSKKVGRVLWIRGRYGKPLDNNYIQEWRSNYKLSGGGILIDQGLHMIDIFQMLGGNFTECKSFINNTLLKKNIEDNAFVILKNKKITASLHSTLTQWRHLFSLEIFLTKGYIVINGLITPSKKYGEEVINVSKNVKTFPEIKWKYLCKKKFNLDDSFNKETNLFIESIINKKTINIGNLQQAISCMKILDKIYKENKK